MKFRYMLIFILSAIFLAGCSLASDITPPPNYVSPTPLPTLGLLYPASAPDIQNGAMLFTQNCAPCHGDTGLGNGPQSQQLPVTVPALGLADTARSDSPAQWFTTVSQGNLDRFMPPFIGDLSDQDRWDVVAYALTLHTKPDQIAQGKALFDANCSNCADKFTDQKMMAALSEDDIIRIIKNGQGDIPAFGKNFSDDQALDVAMYIRTLTFASTSPHRDDYTGYRFNSRSVISKRQPLQQKSLQRERNSTARINQRLHPAQNESSSCLHRLCHTRSWRNSLKFMRSRTQAIKQSSSPTMALTIPFIKFPNGAQNTGYEPDPNSATTCRRRENGVAAPPSSNPYADHRLLHHAI